MGEVIASALHRYLERTIQASLSEDPEHRLFFRLEGFDSDAYQGFLRRIKEEGPAIDTTFEIRSVSSIAGFEHLQIAPGRSATWYRNNLKVNHTLVLIFNEPTSDAQSLKDIHPITEGTLVHEIRDLAQAAITRQLYEENFKTLEAILERMGRLGIPMPQLRSLSSFFQAIGRYLEGNPGDDIKQAAAWALPELGLFSAPEVAKELGTARSDSALKRNYDAALLGINPLEQRDLDRYLERLEESTLSENERSLVRSFLREVIIDRNRLRAVYSIPWEKVDPVFNRKAGSTEPSQVRQRLGEDLEVGLAEVIEDQGLSAAAQEALEALKAGRMPEAEALDELYNASKGLVKKAVERRLNRERSVPQHITTEFLAGLVQLGADLVERFGDQQATVLSVEYVTIEVTSRVSGRDRDQQRTAIEQEALETFFLHYHGVESILSAVSFDLDRLWARHKELRKFSAEVPAEKVREALITFQVHLSDEERGLSKSELIWQYNSARTPSLTMEHLLAEAARLRDTVSVPFYCAVGDTREGTSLDLYDPFESLGAWYEQPTDLWQDLEPRLRSRVADASLTNLRTTIDFLAVSWKRFIHAAERKGILKADIETLLDDYGSTLRTAGQVITSDVEASELYSALAKAWVVGEEAFETWAVVPFLHPLKLHWWLERTRKMNEFLASLGRSSSANAAIADVTTFKNSLEGLLGSTGTPAILALPDKARRSHYFLPVTEVDGYELFRPLHLAGLSFGLTDALVSADEGANAAKLASRELQKIIADYLETFPFAAGGLDICLFDSRNSALPGLLVNETRKMKIDPVVDLVVHVERGGAAVYEQVLAWQAEQDEERTSGSYLPKAIVRVLTASKGELVEHVADGDIVILADSLAHDGLEVHYDLVPRAADRDFRGHLPTFSNVVVPHQPNRLSRRVLLHEAEREPSIYQDLYRVYWMAKNERHLADDQGVQFRKEMTLTKAQQSLEKLHTRFNWVVCYDATVDRHLIESTISSTVEVIRYSTGLGPQRQHNLTVSSASRTRDTVVRRLGSRLKDILPSILAPRRVEIAVDLVQGAKQISGDLILRAAGPGTFVNELIGVVAARRVAEKARPAGAGEIEGWVSLDDFSHWFLKGKYPDLLRIRLRDLHAARPTIDLEVLEAKCVDSGNFLAEARDAQRQVAIGVERLQAVFRPVIDGEGHLDAPFWYDQLYQGLLSNLTANPDQARLLEAFRYTLLHGNFNLTIQGLAYVFCHNGVPGSVPSTAGYQYSEVFSDSISQPLHMYHFSQHGLHKILDPDGPSLKSSASPPKLNRENELREAVQIHDIGAGLATSGSVEATRSSGADSTTRAPSGWKQSPAPASTKSYGAELDISGYGHCDANQGIGQEPELTHSASAPSDLEWLNPLAADLERVIAEYDIHIYPIEPDKADVGPTVTRFKVRPKPGERISKLQNIADDLVYRLALENAPIIEPVRGTAFVGIDLPSKKRRAIALEDVLPRLPVAGPSELPFIVGTAPDGQVVIADLAEAPHLLVGGATSSGKSVFLRSLLVCLLETHSTSSLKLLIVDPKRTDFSFFNGLPHLIGGEVVTDAEQAKLLLLALTEEMRHRQEVMQGRSMKVQDFNRRFPNEALPMITVVIDEYAQLVSLMSRNERNDFEQELMQVAAVARASGIHLILATQRPSADVVTGVLKANLPTSIAFRVATRTNSGIVIDTGGAENLLGYGDLLFKRASGDIQRLQAPYLDEETLMRFLERYK